MRVVKLNSEENILYAVVKKDFTFEKLKTELEKANHMRRGSFADKYFRVIVQDIFQYTEDLRQYYQDYYAFEYDNFEDFLYKKQLFEREDIGKLNLQPEEHLLKLETDLKGYNIQNILFYEDSGIELLNKVLGELDI